MNSYSELAFEKALAWAYKTIMTRYITYGCERSIGDNICYHASVSGINNVIMNSKRYRRIEQDIMKCYIQKGRNPKKKVLT